MACHELAASAAAKAAQCSERRGGAAGPGDQYADRLEDCEQRVLELEARVREAQERLDACRDVQDVKRREQACCAELAKTRRAAAELEAKLAAPPVDREVLRTRLRAAQAENLELNQELARFRHEQCVGACERDTCVGYEERIERLTAFFRGVIKEFAGRFQDPEATAQRVVDTLVGAANVCTLDWLEALLAKMQCRQRRALRSETVYVADVVLLERAILAEHRGLLLEEKELRQRDAEVRRQVEALRMVAGERPGDQPPRPAKEQAAWKPLPKGAGRRRAPKKHPAEGLLRPVRGQLAHPAMSPPTPCDPSSKAARGPQGPPPPASPPTPCDPPAPDGPPRGGVIPQRRTPKRQ